ncbi:hypothetical protein P3342_006174 [Pyrenophora teres f. teres]|nr:hypothetical protein P3342_006174 [Pyrenophora teres f. teres]
MAPQTLDQLVKGAPAPNTNVEKVAESIERAPPPYSASILADAPHDANDRLPTLKLPRPPVLNDPTALYRRHHRKSTSTCSYSRPVYAANTSHYARADAKTLLFLPCWRYG